MFHSPWFAIAGLVAAAGPLLIHLLNRQRYKVVPWAAMDFLRAAIRRSRRILRLRDLLLLLLRTACVLAFALALAQPYRQAATAVTDPNQPVHAVIVLDNSLSMAYRQLEGTLLDEARKRAGDYIDRLPRGSRISVLPLCGSEGEVSYSAYRTKEDALEALHAIRPVDRQGSAVIAFGLAKEACQRVSNPTAKQIVLLSDQQANDWRVASLGEDLKQLPSPPQIVRVGSDVRENTWIEDFEVQDGLADLNVPAVFLARVHHQGDAPRRDVQVSLAVDGTTVATQTIDSLEPGQSAEVVFPPYQFDVDVAPGKATSVAAEVSIPQDALADDDRRVLVVPVAAALPVVFVDQLGAKKENPRLNAYGETYRLRRLLAPEATAGRRQSELIQVRHVTLPQLEAEGRPLLENARLVVVAGVDGPGTSVPLLREFVQQGGTLLVAAGAEFDPRQWNEAAWQGGLGILPAPLEPTPVGRTPSETTGMLQPFMLDFDSLTGQYFHIEQESEEELQRLYDRVFFFKAVAVDDGDEARQESIEAVAESLQKERERLQEIDAKLAELVDKGMLSEAERRKRAQLEEQRAEARPQWLLWAEPEPGDADAETPARQIAQRKAFTTLARYTNGLPFLVEREIGRGRVLFVSTGLFRDWNNMTAEYALIVYDRILRRALRDTLPHRNLSTTERLALPILATERDARFALVDPEGVEETLGVDALAADRYGLSLPALPRRGVWHVRACATDRTLDAGRGTTLWDVPLAVNGPAEESELAGMDEAGVQERAGEAAFAYVARGQSISLTGVPGASEDYWRWLILAVFVGLALETAMLAWPVMRGGTEA